MPGCARGVGSLGAQLLKERLACQDLLVAVDNVGIEIVVLRQHNNIPVVRFRYIDVPVRKIIKSFI